MRLLTKKEQEELQPSTQNNSAIQDKDIPEWSGNYKKRLGKFFTEEDLKNTIIIEDQLYSICANETKHLLKVKMYDNIPIEDLADYCKEKSINKTLANNNFIVKKDSGFKNANLIFYALGILVTADRNSKKPSNVTITGISSTTNKPKNWKIPIH